MKAPPSSICTSSLKRPDSDAALDVGSSRCTSWQAGSLAPGHFYLVPRSGYFAVQGVRSLRSKAVVGATGGCLGSGPTGAGGPAPRKSFELTAETWSTAPVASPLAGEKVVSGDHRFDTAAVSLGPALPFGLGRPLRALPRLSPEQPSHRPTRSHRKLRCSVGSWFNQAA